MEANPLAVLAGGAVIGVLAGAVLPRTRREADLFGKAGKKMTAAATAAAAAARDTGLKELEARGISGKAAKAQVGRLLDGVVEAAGTAGEAAASAAKLSGIYEQMTGYFAKKNVADAAKLSQDGKLAADELVAAAKSGDAEKANAAFKTLGGACRGCHDVHREKLPDGTYRIK